MLSTHLTWGDAWHCHSTGHLTCFHGDSPSIHATTAQLHTWYDSIESESVAELTRRLHIATTGATHELVAVIGDARQFVVEVTTFDLQLVNL